MKPKLLLTGVFGPFGIKTDDAEGVGMQMELLNNQITREQEIHSPRQFYYTHALYLLAENISVRTTVLDFPGWKDFVRELSGGGYTHVGINFIVPNVLKAKKMADYIRKNFPAITILLGGYGTIIPDLESIVPHDEKCIGEGVSWLRRYFGEDPTAPVSHPVLQNPILQKMYGYKTIPRSAVLLTGLGCTNGCDFCVTSHVFNTSYTALLPTGKSIFDACLAAEKKLGATGFTIMDENFLKTPERAIELLAEMEAHQKNYVFEIFSSAEVIVRVGIDFLVRLGVKMVWIGVESKTWAHSKVNGINLKHLIGTLQKKGIVVNSSAILFLDHHTETAMQEDIDWVIGLGADLTQFMNYTPFPGTPLFKRLEKDNRLMPVEKVTYRHYNGAGKLNWNHPYIDDPAKHFTYTKNAFRKKYNTSGPGLLNMAKTSIMGLITLREEMAHHEKNRLTWNPDTRSYEPSGDCKIDSFLALRLRKTEKIAMNLRPLLPALKIFSPNRKIQKKAETVMTLYDAHLKKKKFQDHLKNALMLSFAVVEMMRLMLHKRRGHETIVRQPPVQRREYPARRKKGFT